MFSVGPRTSEPAAPGLCIWEVESMITLEKLQDFGADVKTGLARCMGKEDFYLRMVSKALEDEAGIEKLKLAMGAEDIRGGFEAAHALKGVYGNLSLTPLYDPMSELTEILRAGGFEGAPQKYAAFCEKYEELKKLFE